MYFPYSSFIAEETEAQRSPGGITSTWNSRIQAKVRWAPKSSFALLSPTASVLQSGLGGDEQRNEWVGPRGWEELKQVQSILAAPEQPSHLGALK